MMKSLLGYFKSKQHLDRPKRIVRLGIDYGTSNSKIVFRDYGAPGGEKAYVAAHNGSYRIPSAVSVTPSEIRFGANPQDIAKTPGVVWHESLKMRVAGEMKGDNRRYCYGPLPDLPHDFSAKDIATLTVWFLISEGCKAAQQQLRTDLKEIKLGMTLGIPMSFFEDDQLRQAFLDIARNAFKLYRGKGLLEKPVIRLQEARGLLDFASASVEKEGALPDEEVRNWVRTEAEAALWWPFQSPQIGEGPYAQIDIGAGTTNYSVFRIVAQPRNGHWIKESLAFFGAFSDVVGMDAIDKELAKSRRLPAEICLALRGREEELLNSKAAKDAISSVLLQIHNSYRTTWKRARPKLLLPTELKNWESHKIIFIGGGSLIAEIRKEIRRSPLKSNEQRFHEIVPLEQPSDLYSTGRVNISASDLSFLAVSYGLSYLAADIPKADLPGEIPPINVPEPRRRKRDDDIENDWWFG